MLPQRFVRPVGCQTWPLEETVGDPFRLSALIAPIGETRLQIIFWAHGSTLDIFRVAFPGDLARAARELASYPELLNAEDPHDEIYYVPGHLF